MGAPLPPVPGVVSVLLRGTTPGEIWENSLHFSYTGTPPSSANLLSFAGGVRALWGSQIASLCPNRIILTSVVATDLASNTGAQGTDTTAVPGTRGDDVIPANSAVLISYAVAARFRGGHFRTYLLAGGNADNQDAMSWHTAFVTEVQTKWINFLFGFNGSPFGSMTITAPCAVRRHGRYLPNAGPPHYVLTTPLVYVLSTASLTVHPQMASQKGRIGRRSK